MARDAVALQAEALALLATLSTAGELAVSFALQQQGRDPAGQEDAPDVRLGLREDATALHEMIVRGYALLYVHEGEDDTLAFARHLDRMFVMRRLSRLLHRIHQRLLSLYPACPEDVLECVRLLEQETAGGQHLDAEALRANTTTLLPALAAFHARLNTV